MVAVEFKPDLRDASHTLEAALRRAKFAIPVLPRRFLRRESALGKLNDLLTSDLAATRVVAVSAPVGMGKTTLVANAARDRADAGVAWCTLDADDNDSHEFSLSILEAVLTARSGAAIARAASAGRAASNPLEEAMLAAFHGGPLVLVLDECEHVRANAAHATIQRLIRQAPANMSIVLVSSHEVGVSDRGSARLATIRAADLAFGIEDLATLFRHERLNVSDDTLETLAAWVDGSPSASMLLSSAFRDARDRESIIGAALRADCSPHVALFERFLRRLPDDQHSVLLGSSVVEHISGDLARAIVRDPDAETALNDLVRRDIFFDAIPGCPGWYRHRHPSRELAAAELRHRSPADVGVLHTRAARWFLAAGQTRRALTSAVHGSDTELVRDLVMNRWVAATVEEVDNAFGSLRPRVAAMLEPDHPRNALASAAVALEGGDWDAAARTLDSFDGADDPLEGPDACLCEALLRLRLARDRSDGDMINLACAALPDDSVVDHIDVVSSDGVAALGHRAHAEARLINGDLPGAADLLERAYTEAVVNGRDGHAAEATAMLALVTALSGRVRRASALVDELGDGWFPGAELSRGVHATAHAISEYHADNVAAAQAAASEARRRLRPGVYRDIILVMVRARIAACTGDQASADRLQSRAADVASPALYATLRDALGFADLTPKDATNTSDRGVLLFTHPYRVARANLVAAEAAYEAEMYADAWNHLERTLALAERNFYRRVCVDSGRPVRNLLRDYIAQARPFTQIAWQLLVRLPADSAETPFSVEALTERELAVLRLLPTMKSNREIAAEMFFSVNTVKTHLKSIYRKLGVNRRRTAVEEARARSLL